MKRELQKIGRSAYACIKEMVDALETDDDTKGEEAGDRIREDALSVEVRSGWYTPGSEHTPEEFCLLLGTGGPAVRIVGGLDQYGEPDAARLEVQDWGTPWTEYRQADQEVLLTYARCFYFGGEFGS